MKPTHEQMMAGYDVACRYGVYEAKAFALAEAMFNAMRVGPSGSVGRGEMDIDDVRDMLRELSHSTTSAELSKRLGVSPNYVVDVQLGRREPGPKLLAALGLRREVIYLPVARDRVPARAHGGHARRDALTPERRSEIARIGARARWGDRTPTTGEGQNIKERQK